MTHPPRLAEFLAALQQRVAGDLRTDEMSKVLYSTDASIYQIEPYGVLIPASIEDVHAAVEASATYGVPLLPRTAGSSLAGQAVNSALVIDFTRHLDQVLEINAEERWVRVQPGIVLDELNLFLQPYGLQFGPDPASSNRAAMGGIVSNNSTGSHSICYGMTADHVLEAGVILSDGSQAAFGPLDEAACRRYQQRPGLEGEVYRRIAALTQDAENIETIRAGTPRHWRRCGGYNLDRFVDGGISYQYPSDQRFNLARLVCGAEGSLAVLTDIKLNLVPIPQHTALAAVHFTSLYEALLAVPLILETNPSAVELLDHLGLTLCRDVPTYARLLNTFVVGDPDCLLITEFYGESDQEVADKVERLKGHLQRAGAGATATVPVLDAAHQADVWKVRKVALGLLMSIKGDHKPIPFIEDAAVPVEHLADYVTEVQRFCADRGTSGAFYGHASAGCVHIRPLINAKAAAEIDKMPDIVDFSVELLRGYGGSLSSEHGDGRARSWINERFFGPDLYALYRDVKHIFDPEYRLNPGTVVDAPPMTEDLRYGTEYHFMPLPLHLDFTEDAGFDRAVEMCNGAGICRKKTTGTMCPSFMVTREEAHSTRGRANALRAALTGHLPAGALTSQEMYDVMDLCIECKACKAECPSSVDMAKIKFEFLAQYHRVHGKPRRSRLFGDIARISRMSSGPMAGLSNWSLRNPFMRRQMEQRLGISSRRPLPPFAEEPFDQWFRQRGPAGVGGRPVVLFNDTFNTYNTPEVAQAATEVLEAAGYRVILPGHRCCGRPMISKGLVDEARAAARDTVGRLAGYAAQGIPIVGLEPSCILSLRDEYLYLLPGEAAPRQVAEQTFTFEEFMDREVAAGRMDLRFTDDAARVLLHGHCHQKALVGTGPSRRVLRLPPNYAVEEVDSGCCGMAGSFGYEAEHYDVSIAMAERRLLPAVRAATRETMVVAAGVSCRHQIEHGTGRTAWHPAQVLRQALR